MFRLYLGRLWHRSWYTSRRTASCSAIRHKASTGQRTLHLLRHKQWLITMKIQLYGETQFTKTFKFSRSFHLKKWIGSIQHHCHWKDQCWLNRRVHPEIVQKRKLIHVRGWYQKVKNDCCIPFVKANKLFLINSASSCQLEHKWEFLHPEICSCHHWDLNQFQHSEALTYEWCSSLRGILRFKIFITADYFWNLMVWKSNCTFYIETNHKYVIAQCLQRVAMLWKCWMALYHFIHYLVFL